MRNTLLFSPLVCPHSCGQTSDVSLFMNLLQYTSTCSKLHKGGVHGHNAVLLLSMSKFGQLIVTLNSVISSLIPKFLVFSTQTYVAIFNYIWQPPGSTSSSIVQLSFFRYQPSLPQTTGKLVHLVSAGATYLCSVSCVYLYVYLQ